MASILLVVKHALEEEEAARRMARIAAETSSTSPVGHATAGGDRARLRGLPAVGRGCAGAIRGTNPLLALLDKEEREGR